MNIDKFFTLSSTQQACYINELLQHHSLDEVASTLNISRSKLSALMKEGNFAFIKSLNQYCKYITDQDETPKNFTTKADEALAFLQDNLEAFKTLIDDTQNTPLNLDPRIYAKDTTLTSKSFKINDTIYTDFTSFCEENYSYLKLQDLFSQALLEFIQNHQS